jgi:NAD(P)-dependent dehydrogenase (short-subunit alcohol dehydrogenase family)
VRVALITGATSGIGLACARRFAEAGWGTVLVGRREQALAAAAGEVQGEAVTFCGDVAFARTSRDGVAAALARFGRLDAVVGNAGITLAKTVDETGERELDRLLAVNLKSLVYLAQAAHEPLAYSQGAYVICASNKGLVGQRRSPIYVATKGAAVQLARALALDWAAEGIRVNAICPGFIDTPMLPDLGDLRTRLATHAPMARLGRPEEIGTTARFLLSTDASFITGTHVVVDGGCTIADL